MKLNQLLLIGCGVNLLVAAASGLWFLTPSGLNGGSVARLTLAALGATHHSGSEGGRPFGEAEVDGGVASLPEVARAPLPQVEFPTSRRGGAWKRDVPGVDQGQDARSLSAQVRSAAASTSTTREARLFSGVRQGRQEPNPSGSLPSGNEALAFGTLSPVPNVQIGSPAGVQGSAAGMTAVDRAKRHAMTADTELLAATSQGGGVVVPAAIVPPALDESALTNQQITEWERLQDDFVAAVGSSKQPSATDPEYRERWQAAQLSSDQMFRLKFGTAAFLQQNAEAGRHQRVK